MNTQVTKPTATGYDPSVTDSEVDLMTLLGTMWRAKWLIAFTTLIAIVIGVYYLLNVADRTYVASTIVTLENRQDQVTDLESVIAGMSSDQATINTEIEVIQSRHLMFQLVDELNLVEDPLFNPQLEEASPYSLRSIINFVLQRPESPDLNEQQIREIAVDRVLGRLSVSNVRQSYVFRITIETDNPRKSAEITDTIARIYIQDQLATKYAATEDAISFLSDRSLRLQSELEEAELAVKDFAATNDLVTRETLALKNRQLAELRDRQATNAMSIQSFEERIAALEVLLESDDPVTALETMDQAELLTLARRIDDSTFTLSDFQASVQRTITNLAAELQRARSQVSVLQNSADQLLRDIELESDNLLTFEQLQREAEASRLLYEYFLSRLKEADVQQGIQQPDARIISPASVPRSPSSPRSILVLGFAAVVGALAGMTISVIRELRLNGVRTSEELEKITNHTVTGQIPRAKFRRRKDLIDFLVSKPNSPFAEAIRNLRTSILLTNVDKPPQVMMLTSSVPGEGKTTIALSLSHNLAGLGKKVLLIEADIRRRTFDQYFETKNQSTLVDSVMSSDGPEIKLSDTDSMPGVDMVFGGKASINAADFFSSERFKTFISHAREQYDYIVIDTPPVLVVPDARIIGNHADAIVYCVHWDKTPKAQPVAGIRSFESINLRVHSMVLSQIDPAGMKRYGYGKNYGSYANYGTGYYDS